MKLSAQMPLVVLTYPGHFLLTALTIQSYFCHNKLVPVIVIVDNISKHCWPDYVVDCENFYKTLAPDVSIVPTSQLPEAHVYNQPLNGWFRQQVIKLHLDQLISAPMWFFTDGDVQFHFPVPFNSVPYAITRQNDNIQLRQNLFVSKLLNISNPGIFTQHPHMDWAPDCRAQVCVSNPPFRTMKAKTLQNLRQYLKDLRGHNFVQAHGWMYDDVNTNGGDAPFIESEWELIENFRTHVLGEDINLIYYPTVPWSNNNNYNSPKQEFCTTCFASDAQLGRSWFEQQNIVVSDQIWKQLKQIKK